MSAPKIFRLSPRKHDIEGYGSYGFRFGGLSHRGSILALPSGIYAWDVSGPEELSAVALAQVLPAARATSIISDRHGRGIASARQRFARSVA